MNRKRTEVLAEIDKLIDEEMALLVSNAGPSEGLHYVRTKRRIDELLTELAGDESRDE